MSSHTNIPFLSKEKMLTHFDFSEKNSGFLLWQVSLTWRRQIEEVLKPYQLTHIQFLLLSALGHLIKDGHKCTQNELAHFTRCDITMTSQVLRGLEKKKLLTRSHKKGDDRAKYPSLTLLGIEKLKMASKAVDQVNQNFFSSLKENEASFNTFMKQLLIYPI